MHPALARSIRWAAWFLATQACAGGPRDYVPDSGQETSAPDSGDVKPVDGGVVGIMDMSGSPADSGPDAGEPVPGVEALWSRRYGSTPQGYRGGTSVTVDPGGNVIIAGYFDDDGGSAGPNTLAFGSDVFTAQGKDAFVAKLGPGGNPVWADHLDATGDLEVGGLAADSSGNVIVGGWFVGTLVLGGDTLDASNGNNFLVKYDANGNVTWSRSFVSGWSTVDGVAVDTDDNILIAGGNDATIDFDGRMITTDGFVAKLDPGGAVLFAFGMDPGGVAGRVLSDVSADPLGNVLFAGVDEFSDTSVDIAFGKLSPSGSLLWRQSIAGPGWDTGFSVATDASGNIFVAGVFEDAVTVGGETYTMAGDNLLIASFDPGGAYRWSSAVGPVAKTCCSGPRLSVDGSGNVVVAGTSDPGDLDFGGAKFTASTNQIFVAEFSGDGDILHARLFTATSWCYAEDVVADAAGATYITGNIHGRINLGAGYMTAVGGDGDVFVAKFGE
jgi:hypothetical protein